MPLSAMIALCVKRFSYCLNSTFAIAFHTGQILWGWLSDGVIHLEIAETKTDYFTLLGVTWIGLRGIAPFEIDLEIDPNDEICFSKTVFRIGTLDSNGLLTVAK
jgi:hypothetical protein